MGASEPRWRRGRGRGAAPSCPFLSERRGGAAAAAESLSLGHVIVSKRELRGSPESRGPLQNAARRARRCHSRRCHLCNSRRVRESGSSCGAEGRAGPGRPRLRPAFTDARGWRPAASAPALLGAAGAPAAETTKLSPKRPPTALSVLRCETRRERRRRPPVAELPSYLASPLQESKDSRAARLSARPGAALWALRVLQPRPPGQRAPARI